MGCPGVGWCYETHGWYNKGALFSVGALRFTCVNTSFSVAVSQPASPAPCSLTLPGRVPASADAMR
eukprot:3585461-Amphidinium_carterae.1